MLDSLIAVFVTSVSAGLQMLLAQVAPIVIGGPTTLELALVGIVTLALYSVVGRLWRRRADRVGNRSFAATPTESAPALHPESTTREAA